MIVGSEAYPADRHYVRLDLVLCFVNKQLVAECVDLFASHDTAHLVRHEPISNKLTDFSQWLSNGDGLPIVYFSNLLCQTHCLLSGRLGEIQWARLLNVRAQVLVQVRLVQFEDCLMYLHKNVLLASREKHSIFNNDSLSVARTWFLSSPPVDDMLDLLSSSDEPFLSICTIFLLPLLLSKYWAQQNRIKILSI